MKARCSDLHSLIWVRGVPAGDKASSWWQIAAVFSGLEFLYTGLSMTAHESSERTLGQCNRTAARLPQRGGAQRGGPIACHAPCTQAVRVDSFQATQPQPCSPQTCAACKRSDGICCLGPGNRCRLRLEKHVWRSLLAGRVRDRWTRALSASVPPMPPVHGTISNRRRWLNGG